MIGDDVVSFGRSIPSYGHRFRLSDGQIGLIVDGVYYDNGDITLYLHRDAPGEGWVLLENLVEDVVAENLIPENSAPQ